MPSTPEARFDAIYAAHHRTVLAYALRRVPAAEADDVVADTFMTAWRAMDRVPDDPRPWLLGIARNVLLHQRRAAGRRAALRARLEREPQPAQLTIADGPEAVLRALARLPEADREVVMLVCWEGLTLPEAAGVLGTTHVAARVRLHRARRRLAALVAEPTALRRTLRTSIWRCSAGRSSAGRPRAGLARIPGGRRPPARWWSRVHIARSHAS